MFEVEPHHDGSELYLSSDQPKLGSKIELRIRVPHSFALQEAFVRTYHDGEPRVFPLKKISISPTESWWSVRVAIINREMKYRFLLVNPHGIHWLTAAGVVDYDVTSSTDFTVLAIPAPPKWLKRAIFYQIFPDRFASSHAKRKIPDWAIVRPWESLPDGAGKQVSQEYFGGDFAGVEEHLDHIKKLGINGIYFTPFFPAGSTHRYDASTFNRVDPLLGGNRDFLSLLDATRKSKIRVLGDLTTNHTGNLHEWFVRASTNKSSKERSFYFWDKKIPHGYVGWWGVPSLPKLNFASQALRKAMYSGPQSVVKRWLKAPFLLDGWRIDVGNMTGRYEGADLHREVMLGIRQAVEETNSDAWLVAENADWIPSDLDGFGWHGSMNYQGFMRPLWAWLNTGTIMGRGFHGLPIDPPKFSSQQLIASMKAFNGVIPWRSLIASMTLLDSHDTGRFRSVVGGDVDRHLVGMALLLTYPGVPSIFAGDEVVLEGIWGEDARRTIQWDEQATWDHKFLDEIKRLIGLRKSEDALISGGLRFLSSDNETLTFLRESNEQTLLIVLRRSGGEVNIDLEPFGYEISRHLIGSKSRPEIGSKFSVDRDSALFSIYELRHTAPARPL
jgi:alpha-glucosidase